MMYYVLVSMHGSMEWTTSDEKVLRTMIVKSLTRTLSR